MISISRSSVVLGCLGLLAACGGEPTATAPELARDNAAPTAAPATASSDAPPTEAASAPAAGSVATGCPATDASNVALPGTVHGSQVSAAETWTLAGSPHRLPEGLAIDSGGSVTLEPCARVIVGDAQSIWVGSGSTFVAVGREDAPILIDGGAGESARGTWHGIRFAGDARATSKLHHVVIEEAGGDTSYRGAVYLDDGFVLDAQHLRIVRAQTGGITVMGDARFAPSSTGLTITESGTESESSPPVFFARANSVGSLPAGQYTGNVVDEIVVEGNAVATTATWRNPGVRYRLLDGLQVEGTSGPILTVAPGSTLAFAPEKALWVGYGADAGLVLDGGSDDARITLTSARPVPDAGDWAGIYFGEHVSRAATKIAFVDIRYAGRADGYDGVGCGDSAPAAITITGRDLGPRIDHVKFDQLDPASYAIARDFSGDDATDYTQAALAIDYGAGQRCRQSLHRNASGECPDPIPPCQ